MFLRSLGLELGDFCSAGTEVEDAQAIGKCLQFTAGEHGRHLCRGAKGAQIAHQEGEPDLNQALDRWTEIADQGKRGTLVLCFKNSKNIHTGFGKVEMGETQRI